MWYLRQIRYKLFVILGHFYHFAPFVAKKSKFSKNENNVWGYYCFELVCQKSQSYHMSFLRKSPENVFAYFGPLLPFQPICGPKNQNFRKIKKTRGINYSFALVCQKSQSYQMKFFRQSTDNIFAHFGPFLPFYPICGPKNQNF